MAEQIILLVEDDPADEALTVHALAENKIGNKVLVAHDGAEALEYLFGPAGDEVRKAEDLPQVVLLDLKLPKIDGMEVLRRIRANERTKLLPVVILTTSEEEDDMVKGYELGANSFVRKPVNFDQFMSVVKELGMYWLVINKCPPGGCAA